jgi:hypothetical protein
MGKASKIDGASPMEPTVGGELRGAERLTLMLRVAKLVGERQELPCIIRDVSATGVRLRLFHPLAAETRLALELANGDFYFIEKVWEKDDEAGFRFASEIDVEAFIVEASAYPRRPIRLRTHVSAILLSRDATHAATVCDLSQNGARIETAGLLAFDQRLRIDAPGLPEIEARVRWRSHPEYGVVFERSFRLDDLARLVAALPAQPDGDGTSTISGNARMAKFG